MDLPVDKAAVSRHECCCIGDGEGGDEKYCLSSIYWARGSRITNCRKTDDHKHQGEYITRLYYRDGLEPGEAAHNNYLADEATGEE